MIFKVKFRSEEADGKKGIFPVEKSAEEVGLKLLDYARAEAQENLDLSRVASKVTAQFCNVTIEITEKQARETGYFERTNQVEVIVPPASLNDFTIIHAKVNRKPYTLEVVLVTFAWECSEQAKNEIIQAWKQAGYPKIWNLVK